MQEIPFWERYMLTIRKAAEYFHIGEKKLRQFIFLWIYGPQYDILSLSY